MQSFCKELISLVAKHSPMFPMDSKTLQTFALAMMTNDLQISDIIEDAASWQIDGVNIWLFRLKGMPGPTFSWYFSRFCLVLSLVPCWWFGDSFWSFGDGNDSSLLFRWSSVTADDSFARFLCKSSKRRYGDYSRATFARLPRYAFAWQEYSWYSFFWSHFR